jgi:signal recognition particle 43 kDa protein
MQEDSVMTWEPTANLSEDLVRDFEEAFWQACKTGDMSFLTDALRWGGETLANLVNDEGRAPLHFAAALNHRTAVKALIDAGVLQPPLLHALSCCAHCIATPQWA